MIEPRPELSRVRPVPHGGMVEPGVLDFSANLNPFGPSPAVRAAVLDARWEAYPDPYSPQVRQAIAARHGVHVGEVLVGNGCSELIDLVCRAFVRPGDVVNAAGQTYGEYERAARLCGATIETRQGPVEPADLRPAAGERVELPESGGFNPALRLPSPRGGGEPEGGSRRSTGDFAPLAPPSLSGKGGGGLGCLPPSPRPSTPQSRGREGQTPCIRLLFLCTPDNPTGRCLPAKVVVGQADSFPEALVVVDEAYAECVPEFESVIGCGRPNVLVLRSLTKAHGLAGLRVGYAVGPTAVIEPMRRARVPWSVNAVAQAAAVAALHDETYTRRTVAAWLGLRDELVAGLRDSGLSPTVAATPFFLLPDPPGGSWAERLLWHGIAVRDCTSFGLPGFARISPRLGPDNARLLAAVREELARS